MTYKVWSFFMGHPLADEPRCDQSFIIHAEFSLGFINSFENYNIECSIITTCPQGNVHSKNEKIHCSEDLFTADQK